MGDWPLGSTIASFPIRRRARPASPIGIAAYTARDKAGRSGWGVAWNITRPSVLVQQPPGSQNWCIGCTGAIVAAKRPGQHDHATHGIIEVWERWSRRRAFTWPSFAIGWVASDREHRIPTSHDHSRVMGSSTGKTRAFAGRRMFVKEVERRSPPAIEALHDHDVERAALRGSHHARVRVARSPRPEAVSRHRGRRAVRAHALPLDSSARAGFCSRVETR